MRSQENSPGPNRLEHWLVFFKAIDGHLRSKRTLQSSEFHYCFRTLLGQSNNPVYSLAACVQHSYLRFMV